MSLKETLENTIINNVETYFDKDMSDELYSSMDYESVSRTAGYIEEEMKANMIEFYSFKHDVIIRLKFNDYHPTDQELLEEFLTNKYKKE